MQEGEYARICSVWFLIPPGGRVSVLSPAHTVTEHEDGTISVWPSILDKETGWHGWLKKGRWVTNYHES
jgi:Family of unknown function (DUF6527)